MNKATYDAVMAIDGIVKYIFDDAQLNTEEKDKSLMITVGLYSHGRLHVTRAVWVDTDIPFPNDYATETALGIIDSLAKLMINALSQPALLQPSQP